MADDNGDLENGPGFRSITAGLKDGPGPKKKTMSVDTVGLNDRVNATSDKMATIASQYPHGGPAIGGELVNAAMRQLGDQFVAQYDSLKKGRAEGNAIRADEQKEADAATRQAAAAEMDRRLLKQQDATATVGPGNRLKAQAMQQDANAATTAASADSARHENMAKAREFDNYDFPQRAFTQSEGKALYYANERDRAQREAQDAAEEAKKGVGSVRNPDEQTAALVHHLLRMQQSPQGQ